MSYIAATAPTSGPPGPLRVPGSPQLGAVEPHSHQCACSVNGLGDVPAITPVALIGLGLAGLWFLGRRRKR